MNLPGAYVYQRSFVHRILASCDNKRHPQLSVNRCPQSIPLIDTTPSIPRLTLD